MQEFRDIYLVLYEKLHDVCAEIEEAAESQRAVLIPRICEIYGVTEQLKAEKPMEWIRQMNMIERDVEENILTELVYAYNRKRERHERHSLLIL